RLHYHIIFDLASPLRGDCCFCYVKMSRSETSGHDSLRLPYHTIFDLASPLRGDFFVDMQKKSRSETFDRLGSALSAFFTTTEQHGAPYGAVKRLK
ncbi:MAG: hypothetical protein IJM07_05940, partial [Pyramidobacter sp.]|nr:hypothetical protein [Pyramidobacter sp.]